MELRGYSKAAHELMAQNYSCLRGKDYKSTKSTGIRKDKSCYKRAEVGGGGIIYMEY